ncbi:hypothetical protein BGZ65_007923 [Modicella reniformis]|uniref:Uncharacterized protein n=1 Tax=Modicella reniformis TaxID=1440133 RepID=A0A9P6IWD0_9FUNG|nr:hypothetical protein BGZ65_007923 [Modicella reniformis]
MAGAASISQLPVTVFTLSQYNELYSRGFDNLWNNSREPNTEIVLHLNKRVIATVYRRLRDLFQDGQKTLVITGNHNAESVLSDLASSFSSTISNMNKTVTSRLTSG